MAWYDRIFGRSSENTEESVGISYKAAQNDPNSPFAVMAAGIADIIKETEDLRSNTNYNTDFELYDDMLNYDPELNGAVRTISLTANKYRIVGGKNQMMREAIHSLVDRIDFDDFLINAMRNLMVYGNDINKLVGRSNLGITEVQSLPVSQITITDDREIPFAADRDNPIMRAVNYVFRENKRDTIVYPASEILHIRIDYRSYWFEDNLGRTSYGVWGASRFSALKQPIRAKYNSMNNRIALEDSMTKQFITIDKSAIEHITDPEEQQERLTHIMNETGKLLDGLRSDQTPILPSYIKIHHMDMRNTIPDNSGFLDNVNADISAVLHVPRVSMGQERGSTFAATFNANQWSVQAIRRLQQILVQSVSSLFSTHLRLLGIEHQKRDLPVLEFEAIDEESPFQMAQRAKTLYDSGIITLDEARKISGFEQMMDGSGDTTKKNTKPQASGDTPRENEVRRR